MTQLPEVFNPDKVEQDDRSFEPIPAGLYNMQVIESRIEDTKSGSGQMLVLTLEVVDGDYQNRRIWDRLNIRNDNADAQRIAQQALKALCEQMKIKQLTDSEQLHFKPFKARVRIEQDRTGQYGPQNRVRYNVDQHPQGNAPTNRGQAQTKGSPSRPAPAQGKRPWNKPAGQQQAATDQGDEIPF